MVTTSDSELQAERARATAVAATARMWVFCMAAPFASATSPVKGIVCGKLSRRKPAFSTRAGLGSTKGRACQGPEPQPARALTPAFVGGRPLPVAVPDPNIGPMRKAGGLGAGMQRVRIGLTGLAFVFLAVLLAMVFTRQPAGEEPITANLLDQQSTGQAPPAPPEED